MATFFEVITAAVKDIEEHGFDSQERIQMWIQRIREAAIQSMVPESVVTATLNRAFRNTYVRLVERGQLAATHNNVTRFTLQRIKPKLHAELERRIMVSRSLIKLNRQSMIEKTTQRFAGWASSIPPGGSNAVDKKEVKETLRKALAQLPFEERRVMVDQGHKFLADLNNIVAVDGGAIALIWRSHWRRPGYNYRVDHKERDGRVYLLRGNWAQEKGLVKKGAAGYYDEVTAVGEEVFCSCSAEYVYNLRDLPDGMVTEKGKTELAQARARLKVAA